MTLAFHQKLPRDQLDAAARSALAAAEFAVNRWPAVRPEDRAEAKMTILGLTTCATVLTDGLDLDIAVRLVTLQYFLERAPTA